MNPRNSRLNSMRNIYGKLILADFEKNHGLRAVQLLSTCCCDLVPSWQTFQAEQQQHNCFPRSRSFAGCQARIDHHSIVESLPQPSGQAFTLQEWTYSRRIV